MFLIIDIHFHHKNKIGLINILEHLKFPYKFGNLSDINSCDIIYSPSQPIDTSLYPNKKFIFGNQFSVFPDKNLLKINNIHKNSIYIQPSEWAMNVWVNANRFLPIKIFPFPVDTNKFYPSSLERFNIKKTEVFIYFKRRNPAELTFVESFLKTKKINYKIFDYVKKYDENDYLSFLQKSKFGIILDAHESQGFAIQEALSCDVPLFVWNTISMNQEYGSNYSIIPCNSLPYWDERCGEYFYNHDELKKTFELFINKLKTYKPREYILENLSLEKCAERFLQLFEIKTP